MKKTDQFRAESRQTLLGGAATVGASVMVVKIIGLLYKIPLMNVLGAEGMGYFNSAYEIYLIFCMIATAGLPVAMSALISKYLAEGNVKKIGQIYKSSIRAFTVAGLLGFAVMLLGADLLAGLMKNSNARDGIAALSPGVLLIFLTGVLRGYFQGHGDMKPTAISQMIEAAGKLLFGLLFSTLAVKKGLAVPQASACAVLGLTLGSALSTAYLLIEKHRRSPKCIDGVVPGVQYGRQSPLRELLRIAMPITLGAFITSMTRLLDTFLILRRLQHMGFSEALANSIYGSYTTLALPIFNLVPSLTAGVALSLVPMLSSAIQKGDRTTEQSLLRSAVKIEAILALPASLGIAAFSKQILNTVYGNHADAVELTAPLLSVLAVSILLSCLITSTSAILQAYGRVDLPVISTLVGAAVKLLTGYLLIGNPNVGILGAPISTLVCNATVLTLNYTLVCRHAHPIKGAVGSLLKLLLSSGISVAAAMLAYYFLDTVLRIPHSTLNTLASVALAAGIYLITVLSLHALSDDELEMIPLIKRIRRTPKKKDIQLN
ncbi:MAG: polysaccharide biosynthesis protein [Clostridia bacterium]|nr:polysaccharide biosynthesis protein [Clostridia bacterium]